jgi:hypothetical protein
MPSVVGLLEQHEFAARRRVDELREEADRIQTELAAAEQEWQEWMIARRRVETVLAPDSGTTADTGVADDPRAADAPSTPREAAKPKSQVPVWQEGLAWSALSVDYQRKPHRARGPGPAWAGADDLSGAGRIDRHGPGASAGGGAAVEGETPGRAGLAGRTAAGPVHPRPRRERARRRVMSRVIDQ